MNIAEAIPEEQLKEDFIDDVIQYFRESGMNPRQKKYAVLFFCKKIKVEPTQEMIRRATGGVDI